MVVDKMDTAQRGVEFLKKNNIGSTTFVALDKVWLRFSVQFLLQLYIYMIFNNCVPTFMLKQLN